MTDTATKSRGSFSALAMLMFAIALGGFVYAGLGLLGLNEAQIPSDWKTVQGQVVAQTVEASSEATKPELFKPIVRYRYEVDGQFLLSDQLMRNHPGRTLKGVAETEIEGYATGSFVTVFFNPANPQEAVLQKSDTIGPLQAISAGLAIGVSAFGIGVVSLRRKRKPADQS